MDQNTKGSERLNDTHNVTLPITRGARIKSKKFKFRACNYPGIKVEKLSYFHQGS